MPIPVIPVAKAAIVLASAYAVFRKIRKAPFDQDVSDRLDRVDEGRSVDRGRGRLEPRETERDHAHRRDGRDGINDAANAALSDEVFTRNIQAELLFDRLPPSRPITRARGEPFARRSRNLLR